ncbi:MAG: response regulator [Candidatus Saccharimonadales bacterium]
MHILLLEPDRIMSNVCAQFLTSQGFLTSQASSAQSAIHQMDNKKPDIVVVEMDLKDHNGVEFLYEMRSYREWFRVPVIIYSFVPPAEFREMNVLRDNLGVVGYLYKPVTSLHLLAKSIRHQFPVVKV